MGCWRVPYVQIKRRVSSRALCFCCVCSGQQPSKTFLAIDSEGNRAVAEAERGSNSPARAVLDLRAISGLSPGAQTFANFAQLASFTANAPMAAGTEPPIVHACALVQNPQRLHAIQAR